MSNHRALLEQFAGTLSANAAKDRSRTIGAYAVTAINHYDTHWSSGLSQLMTAKALAHVATKPKGDQTQSPAATAPRSSAMEHGTVKLDVAEQAMIAKQTAKDLSKLGRQLRHVRKTGFPPSQTVNEVLSANGLIEFGRPTESIQPLPTHGSSTPPFGDGSA